MKRDIAEIDTQMSLYRASRLSETEQAELKNFDEAWSAYQKVVTGLIPRVKSGDDKGVQQDLANGIATPSRTATDNAMEKLITINQQLAEQVNQQGHATFITATRISFAASGLGILIAVFLGVVITQVITRPLRRVTEVSRQIADLDLAAVVEEMNALAHSDGRACVPRPEG